MRFEYEFEDCGPDAIVYESEPGQKATIQSENGTAVLYVNREACLFLAKLFAQLATARMSRGFHVHLGTDFDPEAEEKLRIVAE